MGGGARGSKNSNPKHLPYIDWYNFIFWFPILRILMVQKLILSCYLAKFQCSHTHNSKYAYVYGCTYSWFNKLAPPLLILIYSCLVFNRSDSYHRTVVMSSLIQGVYLLQQEKQVNPLTNRWWESFGFSLATILINQDDGSIYGAVFENNKYQNEHYSEMRPRSVIAFRGTLLKSETWYSDVKEGMRCFFNNLNKGSRFQQATQAVKNVLEKHPTETTSVWLAGHSLGAGIALMVGRTLAKDRFPLKTFAFNPPILLSSLGIIPNIDVFKGMFLFAESCIKVAVVAYQQVNNTSSVSKKCLLIDYKCIIFFH